jgi:acyl-CoA thioesterase-2
MGAATPSWNGRDVADLLGLEQIAPLRFRTCFNEINENGRVYGGQMLGQALMAAARTVSADRPATFLQFLFLSGALPDSPIDYEVTPLQDGKRFASRNVRGSQPGGRAVCNASVSFATPIDSPSHMAPPTAHSGLATDPEGLPDLSAMDDRAARDVESTLAYVFRPHSAIDFRAAFAEDLSRPDPNQPRMRFWIRLRAKLSDDAALHSAAFAYLSDFWINFAACIPHVAPTAAAGGRLYVASLNHAIWLHRRLRVDDWLLFDCVSPSGAFGRGLSIARVYDRAGSLVASVTQECLLAPTTQ